MVYHNDVDVPVPHLLIIGAAAAAWWVSMVAYVSLLRHRNSALEPNRGVGSLATVSASLGVIAVSIGGIVIYDNGATTLGIVAGAVGAALLLLAPLVAFLRPKA